jgi:hypothetical protein
MHGPCLYYASHFEIYFKYLSFQKNEVFDALRRYTKPANLWELYAFSCDPSTVDKTSNPKSRLLKEYERLFSKQLPKSGSGFEVEKDSMHKNLWRLTTVNSSYSLCSTYPSQLIVPKSIRYFSSLATSFASFCSLKHMLKKLHIIYFLVTKICGWLLLSELVDDCLLFHGVTLVSAFIFYPLPTVVLFPL